MILERIYDDKLAQASYLVGCAASGEALIVDPNRDIQQYVAAASSRGLRITHVTETHIHADFASGSRELARETDGRLYLSAEGGRDWSYGFAEESGAVLVRDGDVLHVGNIKLQVIHTPGHTPEHISFLVTDGAATDQPMGLLSGDFIFVGDVGRPDLLEKAAGVEGAMESGARQLFGSLQRLRELPDHLQIWPGHGAGSACGKALGAVPMSTLGYERAVNWAFSHDNEADFVAEVLTGQPEPPTYFARMKQINRDGPDMLGGLREPIKLTGTDLGAALAGGSIVVDTRPWPEFAAAHVPGTLHIPYNRSFTTWAGWLVPENRDFYLIVDNEGQTRAREMVRDLAMIGLDRVGGAFDVSVLDVWANSHGGLESTDEIHVEELVSLLRAGSVQMLDVRGVSEYDAGHIPDASIIPLGYLGQRLDQLDTDRLLVLYCQTGGRSAIGTSIVQAAGIRKVANLRGGIVAWNGADQGIEAEGAAAEA